MAETQLQLKSTITSQGQLQLALARVPVPQPKAHEVLVRIEAAPINPSDLAVLINAGDINTLAVSGQGEEAVATMAVPPQALKALAKRLDKGIPVGNEGGGTVVAAGSNCQALLGKTVGVSGGGMYCQYRVVPAASCLAMHPGTDVAAAASSFINPLTALCMVETMRLENHTALVHTAAASNLGQMLVKICQADGVPLVNIVRKPEQVELLQGLGAEWVCNSSAEDFSQQLVQAVAATGATLAFDAIGGGRLAGQILTAMENVASQAMSQWSPYGSEVTKQVYVYGALDLNPIQLNRSFGMCWGVGGWLLPPFLQRLGMERFQVLRRRVADEINTTFASHYTREISLREVLAEEALRSYTKQATGEKYLIRPQA
ncbi:zinc-binding dehydrogenase [Halioxenophilus sp. WMMB6]|uniref:zinc-binding dehydrogenase n=1 Tax=Halioxenophilus sp. WMMB6 TaxID=3073815 RepID=UPI00295F0481|nr:zinc-binding dehydrogenase [Halioxenophilus sp. WMMB6]